MRLTLDILRPDYKNIMLLPGAVLSGLLIYAVLANLIVPTRIVVPASIIISVLVFNLTNLILKNKNRGKYDKSVVTSPNHYGNESDNTRMRNPWHFIFLLVYMSQVLIAALVPQTDPQLFSSWSNFTAIQIIDLVAAVSLSFILPGIAIISIIDRRNQFNIVLLILLAYFFSVFLTGIVGYICASMGYTGTEMKTVLVSINSVILGIYILVNFLQRVKINRFPFILPHNNRKLSMTITRNRTELSIFACLVALIVLSTFYLYNGTIIGDQWFHHGRALLLLSGAFRSVVDFSYPFFFHSLLAAFFSISGVPTVNAYVSINFLNIMPVIAFYYFFREWVTNPYWKIASSLACTLLMLGSGFGWIDVIDHSGFIDHNLSQHSALEILNSADLNTGYDILRRSSTFINTSSPEPTGPLLLIGLPAGFFLLGLIKSRISGKFKYIGILTLISITGILAHDEFYLFIIIGSILPLVFNLPQSKNSVYISLVLSILFILFADFLYPVKHYTNTLIFGLPLSILSLLFVLLMWVISVMGIIKRIANITTKRQIVTSQGIKLSIAILIAGVVCYFYVLSFIVWDGLPLENLRIQQNDNLVPSYLIPMKLGIPGLLGITFVVSYLFKRYEKEVFVFGILSIVAFIIGPYYNEYRFSRYVMAGMAGFAAIMVYRIIVSIPNISIRPLVSGLIMGSVISFSSLSLFLFLGFTGLALENPDYDEFHNSLERRIFPSSQDIHFLNFLHNDLINLKTDNVTVSENWKGVNSKLEGFVGTSLASLPKFYKSPFTLNSSTIEGFYNLLNYSNNKYIIWNKEENSNLNSLQVVRFVSENFRKVYDDDKYIVVEVPSFVPTTPSEEAEVAMMNQPDGQLSSSLVANQKYLLFNNQSFRISENSKFIKMSEEDSGSNDLTILGNQKRITLWSKPFQEKQGTNYIETKFQIVDESYKDNKEMGIVWQVQQKQYYLSLGDKGLRLSEKLMAGTNASKDSMLVENSEIVKERGKWYTIKIVNFDDIIRIYVDDLPRIEILNQAPGNTSISKIGLRSFGETTTFAPVIIGQISETNQKDYQKSIYYHNYYPISLLALSKTRYDIWQEKDLSAFSKDNVIVATDPKKLDVYTSKYLDYVKAGGTLYVLNTDSSFDGVFSKLMSIKVDNKLNFDSILNPTTGQVLNVSGVASNIKSDDSDTIIKSFYIQNNQKIAPFAVEKLYGDNGGRIVFVNTVGYYEAIFNSPSFFSTLVNMPSLIDLKVNKFQKEPFTSGDSIVGARFISNLKISGNFIIDTKSLLLPDQNYVFHVNDITVSNNQSSGDTHTSSQIQFNESQIRNLTIYGDYEVVINSNGSFELPSDSVRYSYFGVPILDGSDIKIKLSQGAGADFDLVNDKGNHTRPVKIASGEILLHRISIQPSLHNLNHRYSNPTSILLKEPKIKVNGTTTFDQFYNPAHPFDKYKLLKIDGNITFRLNQIDSVNSRDQNVIKTRSVSYVDLVKVEGNTNKASQKTMFRIPGDIPNEAKERGIYVPWLESMSSLGSIVLIIILSSIVVVIISKLWLKSRSPIR